MAGAGAWCGVCLILGFGSVGALAQVPAPTPVQVPVQKGSWRGVEALTPGTAIHLRTDHRKTKCRLVSVTPDQLVCGRQVYPFAEIRSVTVAHVGRSTGFGTLIGWGAGVGIGAGLGIAVKGAFLESKNDRSAGAGAAVGGVAGAGIGALIGYGTDFTGKTIYKR